MPIEFSCSCGKTLRTPDETAGRQARCPACGSVMTIPGEKSAAPPPLPVTPAGPSMSPAPEPFGAGFMPPPPSDPTNPYQSPTGMYAPVPTGELGTGRIVIGTVIDRAWEIYRENVVPLAGVAIAYMGIAVVSNIVVAMLQVGLGAGQGKEVLGALAAIVGNIFTFALGAWLMAGLFRCFVNTARSGSANFMDLFSGGDVFLSVVGAQLLIGVGVFVTMFVAALPLFLGLAVVGRAAGQGEPGPAIVGVMIVVGLALFAGFMYLGMALSQTVPLIVDRRLGAITAIKTSWRITRGNKLSLFLLLLLAMVIYVLGALFCLVGALFTGPLAFLMLVVAYLQMIGQEPGTSASGATQI